MKPFDYLYRGLTSDYKNSTRVDSIKNSGLERILTDIPPPGTYYYWIEQVTTQENYDNTIYRSVPTKIKFTGGPEIISLISNNSTISISFPWVATGESLEIWKSSGRPDDAASFTLLTTVDDLNFSLSYNDEIPKEPVTGFYHYKLAIQKSGTRIFGSVSSIYYEPL